VSAGRGHWRMVGPWYRWDLRDQPDAERARLAGRPALHKFATEDFVIDFQRDPQSALPFEDVDHYFRNQVLDPLPPLTSGPNAGKTRRVTDRHRVRTETRKLFQPAHSRYYLVAFQLHCDRPGFPVVDPAGIASAGFVLRRRVTRMDDRQIKEGHTRLSRLAVARATAAAAQDAAASDRHDRAVDTVARARRTTRRLVPAGSRARTQVLRPAEALAEARREITMAQRELRLWTAEERLETGIQGWVASPNGQIGTWQPMAPEPDVLVETVYPMFRLGAPPGDPDAAARFGTIFYGLVPTSSSELQPDGSPRLDDTDVYEISCFAMPAEDGGCPALPVWSEPSEPFRLASFHDPDGLAQRPVNVRLPDFAELQASTARPSVRMAAPPGSGMVFPTDTVPPPNGSGHPTGPAEQICFFAIPLITIVAMFLLNLFLPIVMLVFGLWWMLKLKFCIPPSASVEADVTAELSVVPGGIQAAASLDVDVDVLVGVNQSTLRTKVLDGFNAVDPTGKLGTTLGATYSNDALVTLLAGQGYGLPNSGTPAYPTTVPQATHVTFDQVVHP